MGIWVKYLQTGDQQVRLLGADVFHFERVGHIFDRPADAVTQEEAVFLLGCRPRDAHRAVADVLEPQTRNLSGNWSFE